MEQSCFRTKWLMLRYLFFPFFFNSPERVEKAFSFLEGDYIFLWEIRYNFKDIYNLDELLGDIVAG